MAIYPYRCPNCDRAWEVHRSILEAGAEERCECGTVGKRVWTAFKFYRSSSFTEGYDVGLGRHFDTDRQRQKYLSATRNKLGIPKNEQLYKRPKGVKV